ncbi:MAG: YdeI/OmpD-associated family protein [Phycisphaerales bacterium]
MAKKAKNSAKPWFVESARAFRAWLEQNHASETELLVGFHKAHKARAGAKTMSWPESAAEALCFGWIDGVRKSLGADRYTIRFTPRRATSGWSAVNIRLFAELDAKKLVTPAGRTAFEARPHKTGPKAEGYTYTQREAEFDQIRLREFKKQRAAWAFFIEQAPSYQKLARWWVMQAKQEETRQRRLAKLISFSAAGKRV